MDFNAILEQLQGFLAQYALDAIGAILTLVIGFWVVGWVTRMLKRAMEKREIEISLRQFLASIVNIGLKVLLLLSVAGMFGIEVTSFIAIFSALAFAVGLALQGNLANFASGVLILIFKFYKVGDFIEAQGHAGTVKEIQIFHTVLQLLDNSLVIIPNGQVTSGPIRNYTIEGYRRHDATVGIGYDDDIDKAKAVIEQVLKATPNVELDRGYDIFVKELADSSVNFSVRFVATNENFWPAYRHFIEQIKKEFDRNDIGIPYPQMDVHLDKG
ncbi:MAG: mechanosensitive ion channel [Phaeodactylibacter sp.]|nr:mechanosensitive ion channel [Phaeodactylibacter sp.]MCB9293223.1 mechanosensitive ion channel [Lewinellaceae bacterium]